jgi:hypothetical protein
MDNGQTVISHGESVKRTDTDACSQTDTADGAFLGPTTEEHGGPTVSYAIVYILDICLGDTVTAANLGDLRLFELHFNTEDFCHLFVHVSSATYTGVRSQVADNDGLGRRAAAGKSAAATVGTRECFLNLNNLRIHVNIEYLGGHCQSHTSQ